MTLALGRAKKHCRTPTLDFTVAPPTAKGPKSICADSPFNTSGGGGEQPRDDERSQDYSPPAGSSRRDFMSPDRRTTA